MVTGEPVAIALDLTELIWKDRIYKLLVTLWLFLGKHSARLSSSEQSTLSVGLRSWGLELNIPDGDRYEWRRRVTPQIGTITM